MVLGYLQPILLVLYQSSSWGITRRFGRDFSQTALLYSEGVEVMFYSESMEAMLYS